jgi:hypothetical protein
MEETISQLSNDDLYDKMKHYGISKGPVTSNFLNLLRSFHFLKYKK